MKKNEITIEYRVNDKKVSGVSGSYEGLLSLDDGFALLIVKTKDKYCYVPLGSIVCFYSTSPFINLDIPFEDRATA